MACLGSEPGTTGWQAQINPLSYLWRHPIVSLKNGPIPASFCLFSFFYHYNFNTKDLTKVISNDMLILVSTRIELKMTHLFIFGLVISLGPYQYILSIGNKQSNKRLPCLFMCKAEIPKLKLLLKYKYLFEEYSSLRQQLHLVVNS